MIIAYTDGAYAVSKDQGGWSFVILENGIKIFSHFMPVKNTTNNRMEIQAAIEACIWAKNNNYKEITIISDSMYVIGTMTLGYKREKNPDMWKIMDESIEGLTVNWKHVKGHSGDKYNELCDALAVEASHALL